MDTLSRFQKINDNLWEIPKSYRSDMLVAVRVYASKTMLEAITKEKAIDQLINVATLPGIEKYAMAMPDIHQGYGFPIGGIAAFDFNSGIISPGGVGYDINCGVRFLTSSLNLKDLEQYKEQLIGKLYNEIPSGVGSSGNIILHSRELDLVLNTGVNWALKNNLAFEEDLLYMEENGCFKAANSQYVSQEAKSRGADQLGTLGAGNHFLEIQEVETIYDQEIADVLGLFKGQITVMIHTGSRGLGHQVCTDYVYSFIKNSSKLKINLIDRELAFAPFNTSEGQEYYGAMAAAANFAWANRQVITDSVRNVWVKIFGGEKNQLHLVYDVAHNIAKIEKHFGKKLIVHRKGATRAFGPGSLDIPKKYQTIGQPIFIPGSMGTSSYILVGTKEAMQHTFGSTCHGAGRRMSRIKSKKTTNIKEVLENLKKQNIVVRSGSLRGLVEEAPLAYKDVNEVVEVVASENIGMKVAKLKPVGVVKG